MFSTTKKMKKLYCVICGKIFIAFRKTLVLSLICSKCKNEDEKIFKEEESIEISKVLCLIENI